MERTITSALADYTKAASLDPNNALLFIGRRMVYIATGDLDRAMADFERAIPAAAGLSRRPVRARHAKRLKGEAAAGQADIAAAKKIDPEIEQ
jgi:tetratricopeptide (TPR) repeat protein